MNYDELNFAYLVRKEVLESILRESQGKLLTNEVIASQIEEKTPQVLASIKGFAERIKNIG